MSDIELESSALLSAMKKKDYKRVVVDLLNNEGLKKDDSWIDYYCLIHAIIAKKLEIIELLLKHGCRVKIEPPTKKLCTPLYYAVQNMFHDRQGHLSIIEILLKAGASVTDKDANEETPLQLAMRNKKTYAIHRMLSKYDVKSINIETRDDTIHFVIACVNNDSSLVGEFMKKGMMLSGNVDCSDFPNHKWPKYSTLLHLAVKYKAQSVVQILLDSGNYDLTLQDENLHSPLHVAYYSLLDEKKKRVVHDWPLSDIIECILSAHIKNLSNPIDRKGLSHFHIAGIFGNTSLVKSFLEHGIDMNQLNQENLETFLNSAVKKNNEELIDILLKYGADLNKKGSDGMTPINLAMKLKFYNLVDRFLSLKADICIQDDKGNTSIHYAFFSLPNTRELLQRLLLIHQGKMYNFSNQDNLSIFHIACAESSVDIVGNFIKNKVDVNTCLKKKSDDEFLSVNLPLGERSSKLSGSTALHFAAWTHNIDVIMLLLQHKVKVDAVNKDGITPVMITIESPPRKEQVVEIIKRKLAAETNLVDDCNSKESSITTCDIESDGKYDQLVDSICQEFKYMEIIELFIKNKCNLDHVDEEGKPILFRAFFKLVYGDSDVFEDDRLRLPIPPPSFFSPCKEMNEEIVDEKISPMVDSICVKFFIDIFEETVNIMIKNGVNINIRDSERNSIFHELVELIRRSEYYTATLKTSLLKITELLLMKGGNAEVQNKEGILPINQAIHNRETDLLKLFLKYSKAKDPADEKDGPSLHLAALYSCNDRGDKTTNYDMVKILLAHGASIHSRDNKGRTPLFTCSKWGNRGDVMRLFLDEGADVNAKDKYGRTALSTAAMDKNDDCVEILLEYGGDINLKDKSNKSVLQKLFTKHTDDNIRERDFLHVVNVLAMHMRKLQMLGHTFSRKDLLCCKRLLYAYEKGFYPDELKSLFKDEKQIDLGVYDKDKKLDDEMKKELERMKVTFIDKYTSLYDVLLKDVHKMRNYVKNKELKNNLDDTEFPHFEYLLRSKFRQSLTRSALLEPAEESYKILIKKYLPDSCLHSIFGYLANEDLKNLSNV